MGVPWLPKDPSEENTQWEIKRSHREMDGHGASKQNASAIPEMREGVHTTPITGFGMSVQTQVAKGTTGQLIAATRPGSGRASPGGNPSLRRLANIVLSDK